MSYNVSSLNDAASVDSIISQTVLERSSMQIKMAGIKKDLIPIVQQAMTFLRPLPMLLPKSKMPKKTYQPFRRAISKPKWRPLF